MLKKTSTTERGFERQKKGSFSEIPLPCTPLPEGGKKNTWSTCRAGGKKKAKTPSLHGGKGALLKPSKRETKTKEEGVVILGKKRKTAGKEDDFVMGEKKGTKKRGVHGLKREAKGKRESDLFHAIMGGLQKERGLRIREKATPQTREKGFSRREKLLHNFSKGGGKI